VTYLIKISNGIIIVYTAAVIKMKD